MRSSQSYRQHAEDFYFKGNEEKSGQAAIGIYKQVLAVLEYISVKQDDDIRLLIKTCSNLGSCYFNLKCFADAANYYKLCLLNHTEIRRKENDDYRCCIANSIAQCYTQLELKNIPLAALFFKDCILVFANITNKNAEEEKLGNNILQNPQPFYSYWSKNTALSSYLAIQEGSAEVTAMFNLLKIQNTVPQVSVMQQPQPRIHWNFYQPPVNTLQADSDYMDVDYEAQPPTP